MGEHTHYTSQLCTWPLPVIKPNIRETTNIGHDIQAQIDDQVANSARNKFQLQVGERRKEIIQITSAKVIEYTNESNVRTRSDIANESGYKNAMIRHRIIDWLAVGIMSSTHIIDDGITIILNLQRAILTLQVFCKAFQEPVAAKLLARSGANQAIWMMRGIKHCNYHIFCIVRIKRQTWIDEGDTPTKGRITRCWQIKVGCLSRR